jgi:hypothetical protein
MSLAIYGAYRLLNPLQNVVRGFMPAQSRQSTAPARPRPLRVARVMDEQHSRTSAGRMVISGRMADVCAELDRLVEQENKR